MHQFNCNAAFIELYVTRADGRLYLLFVTQGSREPADGEGRRRHHGVDEHTL